MQSDAGILILQMVIIFSVGGMLQNICYNFICRNKLNNILLSVGGIGSIPGAFIGALIMGQAEVNAAAYISTPMRDAIA